jgi:predicted enzyme related to lactoylglutathione lyase
MRRLKKMTEDHGKYVWYDAMTTDVAAAAAFYKEVIGWETQDSGMPDRTYLLLLKNAIGIGGLMPITPDAAARGARPMWMGYIEVDDVDECAGKVKAAAGSILHGPEDIPTVGRFALAGDPHGATFVLFKGMDGQMPAAVAPGTPGHVGWAELHAGDLATAWPFYVGLFGWTMAGEMDMGPMGVYRMFATGRDAQPGEMAGGMMTKTPQMPAPMWLYYFNVDSTEAAIARATGAGAQLLMGPQEVPGGQWIAQFLDPQGAMFAVVSFKR